MYDLVFDRKRMEGICRENGVEFMGIFGSAARGDASSDSDIDVLVRYGKNGTKGLMAMVAMQKQLGKIFGKKVDLVTEGFLSPYFRDQVLSEVKPIYGKT